MLRGKKEVGSGPRGWLWQVEMVDRAPGRPSQEEPSAHMLLVEHIPGSQHPVAGAGVGVDLGRGGGAEGAVRWGAGRALEDFIRTGAPLSEGPLEGGALQAVSDSARNGVPLAAVWRADQRWQGLRQQSRRQLW